MKKGTSQLQNVQAIKWCTEFGIKLTWNWLFGFPGEDEAEIEKLERTIRAIHHLQPPGVATVLFVERFAPYHANPEEWNLTGIRPSRAYRYVYPLPEESLDRMAFFFEAGFFENKEQGQAFQRLKELVNNWQRVYGDSHFLAVPQGNAILLFDTRPTARQTFRRLTGLRKAIYEYCDENRSKQNIVREFEHEASEETLQAILDEFVQDYLMIEDRDRYLSVATDSTQGYKDFPAYYPGGTFAYNLDHSNQNGSLDILKSAITLRTPPRKAIGSMRRKLRSTAISKAVAYFKG